MTRSQPRQLGKQFKGHITCLIFGHKWERRLSGVLCGRMSCRVWSSQPRRWRRSDWR